MKISYSAPAKVILSGEHSVVYGKPAIAAAFDRRLTFEISHEVSFRPHQTREKSHHQKILAIAKIVTDYLTNIKLPFTNYKYLYKIESDIPIGRGLGSSGALACASTAAFYHYYTGKKPTEEIISKLSYQIEKLANKNDSGLDSTVSTVGGLIFFRKEFEFLKSIFQLPYHIPDNLVQNLILIDSGKPEETTGQIVGSVKVRYRKNPKKIANILNQMELITKQLIISIVSNNEALFSKSILQNQTLLEQLGVVSNPTKILLSELTKWGTGKITGAGGVKKGSGYLLFYSKNKDEVINYCQKNNLDYLFFKQSNHG